MGMSAQGRPKREWPRTPAAMAVIFGEVVR